MGTAIDLEQEILDLKRILNVIDRTSPHSTQKYLLYLADDEYPLCMADYEKDEAKRLWEEANHD